MTPLRYAAANVLNFSNALSILKIPHCYLIRKNKPIQQMTTPTNFRPVIGSP